LSELPPVFEKYKPHIEREIQSLISGRDLIKISKNGSTIYEMMSYHLGWLDCNGAIARSNSGKYLRATLTLLTSESVSGNFSRALPAAAAIELIHNFSLVHDDIQDDDELRRHKPTVWKIWGKPQAINVGSAMKTLANLAAYNLYNKKVCAENLIMILKILDESCLKMIEGQYLDIDFEKRPEITIKDYLHMIKRKTAALIECSVQIGALIDLNPVKVKHFRDFGRNLGLAFQIKDDILGIWGNDKKTGKPSGNDIKKKKKSFPVVCALSTMNDSAKKEFFNIYNKKTIDDIDVQKILNILNGSNSEKLSQKKTEQYYNLALSDLKKLPVNKDKIKDYEIILSFLVNRDF